MFGLNATSSMAAVGEEAFKQQLYQSQVGQALVLKAEIESWRSTILVHARPPRALS